MKKLQPDEAALHAAIIAEYEMVRFHANLFVRNKVTNQILAKVATEAQGRAVILTAAQIRFAHKTQPLT